MIKAFPKIFAIGTSYILDIFDGEVEITEKVDGSQWAFGKIDEQIHMRSKKKAQFVGAIDNMFTAAADCILDRAADIPEGLTFYCEYLRKPKHNTLAYDITPRNHLALFGISDASGQFVSDYDSLQEAANFLEIDVVPLLFKGKINSAAELTAFLERESYLGGPTIEGVVVKNYSKDLLIGGQALPIMAGKFVSEKFKEKNHGAKWAREHTGKGKWQVFCEGFRTEARWQKAIQHLRDNGELLGEPKDIGPLLKEIQRDIMEEDGELIRKELMKQFGRELISTATKGFPEWYKQQLVEESFKEDAA